MPQNKKMEINSMTGTVIPLGALYTERQNIIGEYTSLKIFADFCKSAGLKIIQLLPVNDTGTQNSPYSGLSAYALHPIYADISSFPEFEQLYAKDKKFKKLYDAYKKDFSYAPRFNYQEILNRKTELLRSIYDSTDIAKTKSPDLELAKWIEENPWIVSYAVYKNLKWDYMQSSWKSWNKKDQKPGAEEINKRWNNSKLKKEHLFYAWVQFRLNIQFKDSCEYVKKQGIILKGDMPIMMNEDSCDAWAFPEFFNHDLRAGSPVDGENPCGQNWGFPTYNWGNLKKAEYSWWKNRITLASQYYQAYRLDHILGFFRIWAIPERDSTAILGHAEPYTSIARKELNEIGFEDDRIRWLSEPHIKTSDIDYFTWNQEKSHSILSLVAEQIGNEELWLFKDSIRGDKDIYSLDISEFANEEASGAIKQKLVEYWNNRTLIEIEKDEFIPEWTFNQTFAWSTLSSEEKQKLETLINEKNILQNEEWKKQAQDILKTLTSCVKMQACGEDLGVNLSCVPAVMQENNILGLNVIRWSRQWEKDGQPYVDFSDYRKLSVTTTSVHDSSTIRQWWEDENEAAYLFAKENCKYFSDFAESEEFKDDTAKEKIKNFMPQTAEAILTCAADSNSLWCIHPLQDYLYMDERYWLVSPKDERINVPGSVDEFNWTYRMPCSVEDLLKNKTLQEKIKKIADKHDK